MFSMSKHHGWFKTVGLLFSYVHLYAKLNESIRRSIEPVTHVGLLSKSSANGGRGFTRSLIFIIRYETYWVIQSVVFCRPDMHVCRPNGQT